MLPSRRRIRRPTQFRETIRHGTRVRRETLLVHTLLVPHAEGAIATFGFVIPKALGSAPSRNLVKRRLRAISAEMCLAGEVPNDSQVVVRALPPAVGVSYQRLAADYRSAVSEALHKVVAP